MMPLQAPKISAGAGRLDLAQRGVVAFLGAAAFFLVAAVAIPLRNHIPIVVLWGALYVAAVIRAAKRWGPLIGVPLAVATGLAFDAFYIPPARDLGVAFWQNWLVIAIYLALAVMIGMVAARSQWAAEASERARGLLADEQAALRRVATLVARGTTPDPVFGAVAEEVGKLVGVDAARVVRFDDADGATTVARWTAPRYKASPTKAALAALTEPVRESGRAVRVDGIGAAAPIVVEGRLWGAVLAREMQLEPIPATAEARLADFTELIAVAISNTTSRDETRRLAEEQAALRRVATLVARGVPAPEVFTAIAREAGELLGVDATNMGRYETAGTVTGVAGWGRTGEPPALGAQAKVEGEDVITLVALTGRPARVDCYEHASGDIAALLRDAGFRSSVGAPIVVDGALWGVMIASSKRAERLGFDTESRIAAFTELAATAIADTEARTEVRSLADEQAALRRVATLVAQAVPAAVLFAAVTEEVGRLLGPDLAAMVRYEDDEAITVVATWSGGESHPDYTLRRPLEDAPLAMLVAENATPTRVDEWTGIGSTSAAALRAEAGIRCSVGAPIIVGGRLWGLLAVHATTDAPLPSDSETRLTNFTDLVATAIADAQSRLELRRLADEQAALRRVATLVARQSAPGEVFAAVAEEVGLLLDIDDTRMLRYEPDGTAVGVADWSRRRDPLPVEIRAKLEGDELAGAVRRHRRSARIQDAATSAVGTPIEVDGELWGAIVSATRHAAALPDDAEARIAQFTELVATAISNIEARTELAASRERVVAAADAERHRVVRDLHDGAQQRLVHTVVTLKLARRAMQPDDETTAALVTEALEHAERATVELRELVHGIMPAVLARGGLRAGIDALATRTPVPVENLVDVGRLPDPVEATAYFVAAEALTNVAKHADAQHATVSARLEQGSLRLEVRDDGVGGARADGSGLVGLADRLAVLDGRLRVESPRGGGTLLTASIPIRMANAARTAP